MLSSNDVDARTDKNKLILAVAGQVVTGIIKDIAGNDISNSLQGTSVTNVTLMNLFYQRIRSNADRDNRNRLL